MTHGEIIQLGARRAYQCRSGFDRTIGISGSGGEGSSCSIRHLQASSLSVCARGKSRWQRGADSGQKDCFYGQAIAEPSPGTSSMCEIHREKLKRDRHRGSGGISLQGSEAWLERRALGKRFIWNIALTDCQPAGLLKLSRFWFQPGFGPRVIETNV